MTVVSMKTALLHNSGLSCIMDEGSVYKAAVANLAFGYLSVFGGLALVGRYTSINIDLKNAAIYAAAAVGALFAIGAVSNLLGNVNLEEEKKNQAWTQTFGNAFCAGANAASALNVPGKLVNATVDQILAQRDPNTRAVVAVGA